jgi:toxin ParE1/3/4
VKYRILRHPSVARDLDAILRLIAEYSGVGVALAKLAEIEEGMRRLADTPHVGSIRDEIAPGLRAIPVARKGVIVFRVDEAEKVVYLLCVAYAGADWVGRTTRRGR